MTTRITLAKYVPFYIKMQNLYGPPSELKSLTKLDNLTPYYPENEIFALVDASELWLGFILMQKDPHP